MHTSESVAVPALSQDSVCPMCDRPNDFPGFVMLDGVRDFCPNPFHGLKAGPAANPFVMAVAA
jgi:hypothetical protein